MPGRVIFFLQGQRVPASRVRGFNVARALQASGIACDLRVCRPSVYGDTELPLPFRRWRGLYYPAALVSRVGQLGDLRPDDVVLFQRPLFEWPFLALERAAKKERRAVFDFDDAIYLNRGGEAKMRAMTALVDQVIAGNKTLAQAIGAPDKTTVIPTVIDTERFTLQTPRATVGAQVVIGWTGTHGNYRQLSIAKAGIAAALRRTGARFVVIADRPPPSDLNELGAEFVPWRAETEVEDLARLDIGVMPLPDTGYARGKCAFKLLQYMALGRPGVASPVGANAEVVTDGVNGLLAANDADWEEALVTLVTDADLRARLGRAARARVEGAYSIAAVLPSYLKVLARVGLTPGGA